MGEDRKWFPNISDKEWDVFKDDDFATLDGSHHSKKYCGCKPISDEYAKFFIKHELWTLHYDDFDQYEEHAKTVCKLFKINYEGI